MTMMTRVTNPAADGSDSDPDTWTVARAKAHFSEVLERARGRGPQTITRNGRPAAVVVAPDEWDRKSRRVGSLAEFFATSPLRGADDLLIERAPDLPRSSDL
jgi:prevent-host-death family protein